MSRLMPADDLWIVANTLVWASTCDCKRVEACFHPKINFGVSQSASRCSPVKNSCSSAQHVLLLPVDFPISLGGAEIKHINSPVWLCPCSVFCAAKLRPLRPYSTQPLSQQVKSRSFYQTFYIHDPRGAESAIFQRLIRVQNAINLHFAGCPHKSLMGENYLYIYAKVPQTVGIEILAHSKGH